jgi:nitrogen fixation NifU-like protein
VAKEDFNFWQDHSVKYLEMALSTEHRERPDHVDGYGKRTGECGDTVEFFIMVTNGIIRSISFDTDGCMNTNACANTVATLLEGKSIETAWEMTPRQIVDYLETMPEDEYHCAELAVGALYLALSNYGEASSRPRN